MIELFQNGHFVAEFVLQGVVGAPVQVQGFQGIVAFLIRVVGIVVVNQRRGSGVQRLGIVAILVVLLEHRQQTIAVGQQLPDHSQKGGTTVKARLVLLLFFRFPPFDKGFPGGSSQGRRLFADPADGSLS